MPSSIPTEKRAVLERLAASFSKVPHVEAMVLGGSYARGTQHSASDLDIGLYYFEAAPFSIDEIKGVANDICRPGSQPTVTGLYEWGAWVNGGAWIETESGRVDFLYRNLDQVQKTIREASQGIIRHDYDQQPTHGFYSVAYLAETSICIPLFDPSLRIAGLKKQVEHYPPRLKQKIVQDSLWAAEFTLGYARTFAEKADIYNTAGCLTRAIANLSQVLFALNEEYFLSDKKIIETMSTFKIVPPDYVKKILGILACPGETRVELSHSVAALEDAWHAVVNLAEDLYRSRY